MYNLFHKDDTQVKYTMLVSEIFTSLVYQTCICTVSPSEFPLQVLYTIPQYYS